MIMEKIYVNGVGWVMLKGRTLQEMYDYVYRKVFSKDCADPTGIKLPLMNWFNFN